MPEWYIAGGLALGSILFLMFLSMPVAFAFLLVSFGLLERGHLLFLGLEFSFFLFGRLRKACTNSLL